MCYATCVGWCHLWTEGAASPWKFFGCGQSSFFGKQYTRFWSVDTRLAICKYGTSSVQRGYQNICRPPAGRPHSVWTYMRMWHQSFIKCLYHGLSRKKSAGRQSRNIFFLWFSLFLCIMLLRIMLSIYGLSNDDGVVCRGILKLWGTLLLKVVGLSTPLAKLGDFVPPLPPPPSRIPASSPHANSTCSQWHPGPDTPQRRSSGHPRASGTAEGGWQKARWNHSHPLVGSPML